MSSWLPRSGVDMTYAVTDLPPTWQLVAALLVASKAVDETRETVTSVLELPVRKKQTCNILLVITYIMKSKEHTKNLEKDHTIKSCNHFDRHSLVLAKRSI